MRTSANTSNFGVNWLKNVATKVWDIFPYDIKSIENLELLKIKIRKCQPKGYYCRLCKEYVYSIEYDNILY